MLPEARQKQPPATTAGGMPNFVVRIVTVAPLAAPVNFISADPFLTSGWLSSRSTPVGLNFPDGRIVNIPSTIQPEPGRG